MFNDLVMIGGNTLKCGGENKFTVLNNWEMTKWLSDEQRENLEDIVKHINLCRKLEGKTVDREYLVINTDEPYAGEVIEIMKRNGHWG